MKNKQLLDQLFDLTYEKLRGLAAKIKLSDSSETLNPTALVNEAYGKLIGSLREVPDCELHFKRVAARAMRQVLIDAARQRNAYKRGAGQALLTLTDEFSVSSGQSATMTPEGVLAIDAALTKLAKMDEMQAKIVEYKVFGGFSVDEIAQILSISKSKVDRDWRTVRAWLKTQMDG